MSKQEKNCQVPTPTEYVEKMLDYVGYKENLWGQKVLENSCGEGNILLEIVRRYIFDLKKNKYVPSDIIRGLERDIVAYEVDQEKIDICVARLNELLFSERLAGVRWNIKKQDFLKSDEQNVAFVIGNPPYITYHDLTEAERQDLQSRYTVCKKGRFDYCYAFIEASIRALADTGRMIYLVPFSIFRNKFAGELRGFLKNYIIKIVDYRSVKVFPGIICSTTLILCGKKNIPNIIGYENYEDKQTFNIQRDSLSDKGEKWIFEINTSGNKKFGDYFNIHNSVATLLNKAFLFSVDDEQERYYVVNGWCIEKEVTLPAISTKSCRMIKNNKNKESRKEIRIIFPYKLVGAKIIHFSEKEFKKLYPYAWKYLYQFYDDLKKRKADENAKWFEYGRSQALEEVWNRKLVFPMVITKATQTYMADKIAIPYAGYFITAKSNYMSLKIAKELLESEQFYRYVKDVGTPTTITSYRVSVHDISEYMF